MRDEWNMVLNGQQRTIERPQQPATRQHTQGLTRTGRQIESGIGGGDRIAGLTMASRAKRLKSISGSSGSGMGDLRNREVSPRRQVGDAADEINPPPPSSGDGTTPWWKNVGMEEGM